MKSWFARLVLWLIEPALHLHAERQSSLFRQRMHEATTALIAMAHRIADEHHDRRLH